MIVLILEKVPTSLRGELTRWLLELKAGVFVGKVSAMVRDRLWEHVCMTSKDGSALLVHPADTEQGFMIHMWGTTSRTLRDFDGLLLLQLPASPEKTTP